MYILAATLFDRWSDCESWSGDLYDQRLLKTPAQEYWPAPLIELLQNQPNATFLAPSEKLKRKGQQNSDTVLTHDTSSATCRTANARKAPKCSLIRTALKPTTGIEAVGDQERWNVEVRAFSALPFDIWGLCFREDKLFSNFQPNLKSVHKIVRIKRQIWKENAACFTVCGAFPTIFCCSEMFFSKQWGWQDCTDFGPKSVKFVSFPPNLAPIQLPKTKPWHSNFHLNGYWGL